MDRYHRQRLLAEVGDAGQQRLMAARVLIVGCGALGSVIAEQLVRAGVGYVGLADRDIVELTNLQRQTLFDERDADASAPKAAAAARRLTEINSAVRTEVFITDVHAGNIEELVGAGTDHQTDVVLDGTDNVQTRYLINDAAVKHGIPWIYGGCVGTEGRVLAIRPQQTPCLRCLFPIPPRADALGTCDTRGVLGPAASIIASFQSIAVIKLLVGDIEAVGSQLISMDFWNIRFTSLALADTKRTDCICCGKRQFEFLDSDAGQSAMVNLCGRETVQIRPSRDLKLDLRDFAARFEAVGQVQQNPYFLRCALTSPQGIMLTLFGDGRLLVHGTQDMGRARSIYSRFVGA